MAAFASIPSNYEFLKKLRRAKKATLKPCSYLKSTTKLRDYQVIGALHLLSLARMVLGDGVGLGKCLTKDTYLPTTEGFKRLEEFIPQNPKEDTLYPYSGNCGLLTINGAVRPDAVYYCGDREGIKVVTQKGYELIGLGHHPIYAPDIDSFEYKRLDTLKVGDYVCICREGLFSDTYVDITYKKDSSHSIDYKIPGYLDEALAELLGFYVSEGHCPRKYTVVITQFDSSINSRIRELLQEVFGYSQSEDVLNYKKEITINSLEIVRVLELLGINPDARSGDQTVPNSILSSPKSVIRAFLRAYFEGDGGVELSNNIISCSSKSQELLKQIQLLLLSFGITSRLKKKNIKIREERKPYFILYFCGRDLVKFQETIGFISNRKNDLLNQIAKKKRNSNTDIIPIGKPLLKQAIKDIVLHLKSLPEHKGFSVKGSGWKGLVGYRLKRMIEEVIYKKKRLTYDLLDSFMQAIATHNLKEVVSNYSILKFIQDKNYYFDKIVLVEEVRDTFADFHVPEEHNFVGNGFVNHNTLQMITSYVYRRMTEPKLKLIVATPKSAMQQWKEEFETFCVGITVHVLTNEFGEVRCKDPKTRRMKSTGQYGTIEELKAAGHKCCIIRGFAARKAQYQVIKADVLIVNYYAVKEDYKFIIENRLPTYQVAFDECFSYHTPITLADGTTELIGKIVSREMSVDVLSFNFETNKIEVKKVVSFFRNEAVRWYKVKRKRTLSVICSPNHGFYTSLGKKRADELIPGDIVYGVIKKITDIQKQIILGSLLGDGSIRYIKRLLQGLGTGVKMMQSRKRLDYLDFKKKLMSHHITFETIQKSGWNKEPMHTIGTECSTAITDIIRDLNIVNKSGKKVVSKKWLESLTPIGIAIWYCDDGSYSNRHGDKVTLSTHGFSKKENEIIIDYFRVTWGIEFIIVPQTKSGKKLYSLRANKDSSIKLLHLISDYIPPCMLYKSMLPCGGFWETYQVEDDGWERCEDVIEYSTPFEYSKKTFSRYKYNIEVEDNHSYFANNILVSNCQEFKNGKTKTWFGANEISDKATYCYGMSATIIKNRLEEAYFIYRVITPGIFPGKIAFLNEYAVRKKMSLWRKGKKRFFNKVVGYKNLGKFKQIIDPFFLARKTREVADELPRLISRKVILEMSEEQTQLYRKALSGELYCKLIREKYFKFESYYNNTAQPTEKEEKMYELLRIRYEESLTKEGLEKNKIAALSYCQLVSNGPGWLGEEGESSKETEFRRLFDQELSDEKTIVFTRFKTGIKRLSVILDDLGIKYTQITGDNNIQERNDSRKYFQDLKQDCKIIFITQAGSAAINLQAAGIILYYDTPWSYGDLYQSIGRAQRIGSIREHILLLHMVNQKTIDEHVLDILDSKKNLISEVIGDIAEGAIKFKDDEILFKDEEGIIDALYNSVFKKVA